MAWTVDYTDSAKRELKRLDKQVARRIVDYMDNHVAALKDPRSVGKALTGELGIFWRYRVGDCRVICDIQDKEVRVLVVRVGHRRDVYE